MKNQQTTQMLKSYHLNYLTKTVKVDKCLFLFADINNISFITMPKQIQKKTPQYQTTLIL